MPSLVGSEMCIRDRCRSLSRVDPSGLSWHRSPPGHVWEAGKQPSSKLLHTMRLICVCWPPKRQCSISTTFSPKHGSTYCLPGNVLACVTISTNVDDTASSHRARVSHNIHNTKCQTHGYTKIPICEHFFQECTTVARYLYNSNFKTCLGLSLIHI